MANQQPSSNGPSGSASGAQVLDAIATFIRRYLVCDDHQLALLTLWTACTQCHGRFPTAPYLHVRSPLPHSGKSLCLSLLCDLSNADIIYSGVPAGPLLDRLIQRRSLDDVNTTAPLAPFPVLIDDFHHSFGPSERQPLVCMLASGAESAGFFSWGKDDYYLFGPKALTGNAPLPQSLAVRCIPIDLRRPKPSEKFLRYHAGDLQSTVQTLRAHLYRWVQQAASALAELAKNPPPDLPSTLSPGQSKCAEALVHIADAAGGAWPQKARAALAAVFTLAEASPDLQMLLDLRSIFCEKNNPEYLATSDLLSQLRGLENRPWNAWGPKSGRRLAGHLRPFAICSRRMHIGAAEDFMAYLLEDFRDAWERYLPPEPVPVKFEPIEVVSSMNAPPAEARLYAMAAD